MKKSFSLLAVCLCGIGLATAQTTTNTYSTTSTETNPTYTSPVTTDSTNTSNAVNSSNTTNSTSMMENSRTGTNGTYSTNSVASPTTDGTTTDTYTTTRVKDKKDYKNFVFGIYAGLNTTKFKGESVNNGTNSKLTGRLGYQAGFFVRGGGRLFGQIGAEYFASSSNYFVAGSGQSASSISDQINIKYIQVPVYIGYKLTESDRGISAIRVQVGVEYANQIGSTANQFGNLNNFQIKQGTFNGLGQLGFDAGPVFLDLTYHYGFSNAVTQETGFAGSQRRILSASVGFKF
ncbi:PorT family protein [Spirosoma validum]|uniref:PorT family protein n=1 Tax=Spirosoma validum TaxID=2771355 RepID=A0A927GFI7_9BACT|nr:PorT family protein [Spirosoma validum]MBD2755977.1 PorT family protein [Spirosoma validum]